MVKRYSFGWKTAEKIREKTGNKCYYCGSELPRDVNEHDERGNIVVSIRQWDIEHMIPISRGGDHSIENLVPSCKPCNRKKFMKTAEEFVNEIN